MRSLWLTAGAVATVIALLISTLLLWHGFSRATMPVDHSLRSIPFTKSKVEIQAVSQVHLAVGTGRAGELLISRTLRWSRDRPDVSEDWDADASKLRLQADCPRADQPDGPMCHAQYMIIVPPETDIVAGTTSGRLSVTDVFGSVRLTTVSGDLSIVDVAGPVWARAGTGNIAAEQLGGDAADVEVGSGDVKLSFTEPPTSVRAVIRTRGDINVDVPRGAYHVIADGTNTTVDVKRDVQSPRKIAASVQDGSVSLCCR